MALHTSHRLPRKDFRNVSERGKTARSSFLFIRWAPNARTVNRFGFVVPLKASRKATARNKVRRLLGECVRPYLIPRGVAYDIIVIVSAPVSAASGAHIRETLAYLMKRAGITA